MNYDPNLTNSGRTAIQTVRLTFQQWGYKAELTTTVNGNLTGLDVIATAVDDAFGQIIESQGEGCPEIEMTDDNGNTMFCADHFDDAEDWLKNMLVQAEITDIQPIEKK